MSEDWIKKMGEGAGLDYSILRAFQNATKPKSETERVGQEFQDVMAKLKAQSQAK